MPISSLNNIRFLDSHSKVTNKLYVCCTECAIIDQRRFPPIQASTHKNIACVVPQSGEALENNSAKDEFTPDSACTTTKKITAGHG